VSRKTHNKGVSGSTSTSYDFPLMESVTMPHPSVGATLGGAFPKSPAQSNPLQCESEIPIAGGAASLTGTLLNAASMALHPPVGVRRVVLHGGKLLHEVVAGSEVTDGVGGAGISR